MRIKDILMIQGYIKQRKERSIWKKLVRVMACIVVFCTTYALILPVITLERSYICGLETHSHSPPCLVGPEPGTFLCSGETLGVHAHTGECFDQDGMPQCGYSDQVLHIHDEFCFGSDGQLLCLLPEVPEHIHSVDCYAGEALVCGLEALTEHIHSEDCPGADGQLQCGCTEILRHQHDADCPIQEEPQWGCGLEEHSHDDSCIATRLALAPMAIGDTATLELDFTIWGPYNPVYFPDGNTYSCHVGDVVTIRIPDTDNNATYNAPELTVSGCEVVSVSSPCSQNHSSHNNSRWYNCGFAHVIVVRITDANASVACSLPGDEWNRNANSVTIESSGGTAPSEPSVSEPAVTDPPVTEATEPTEPEIIRPGYPTAVKTGKSSADTLYFFNFEATSSAVLPLEGCVFEIRSADGQYVRRITSGNTLEVELPADIPVGDYTITQISAPYGYLRDDNFTRSFSIEYSTTLDNQKVFANNTIGSFLNHSLEDVNARKTAEVEDYNNRTYEIILSAAASIRLYEMEPIDVLFVVDQSNSMLFPAGLEDTGKRVRLYQNQGSANTRSINQANLDRDKVYYIIADPQGTSTVFALWYNNNRWLYQDASYYAKAFYDNAEGYRQDNETAAFPSPNQGWQGTWTGQDGVNYKANGGDIGYALGGTLGNDIGSGGNKEYQIYTAVNEYNRLHYLEESITRAVYQLSDSNPENTVTLIRFTKEVDEASCIGPLEMTPENASLIVDSVNKIQTDGGTRQDLALEHAYNHLTGNITYKDGSRYDKYNKDHDHTITFLITDGAPVRSGSSAPSLDNIYRDIETNGAKVRQESILVTIGLGMGSAERGKQTLQNIATPGYSRMPEDASELSELLHDMIFSSMTPKEHPAIPGDITDVISDSFYPIAWVAKGSGATTGRQLLHSDDWDWIVLEPGDWIDVNGRYVGTRQGTDGEGRLIEDANGDLVIHWSDRQLKGNPSWTGHFYVKAKEDFIGGNAIDTNKSAGVEVHASNDDTVIATMDLPDPSVNVRLLDMNENSSEVTVYLGDLINEPGDSPIDTLRRFYEQTRFTKLVADFPDKNGLDYGPILNALDPDADPGDGLERGEFYLSYALGGELTDEQWEYLMASEENTVRIDYTYDDDSSHGPVGYFTFRLTKNGDSADFDSHEATQAGQHVEDYALHVTYTAYELGEASVLDPDLSRPQANLYNGSAGPGTEVSPRSGGGRLEEGYGIVHRDNLHIVHVICGSIEVTKQITPELISDTEQTYRFTLLREEDGQERLLEVTIAPGEESGTATVTELPRGTYVLYEHTSDVYNLRSMEIGADTNCFGTLRDTEAVFHMGNDPDDRNVIGKLPDAWYTSYTGSPNGVYGEAVVVNEKTVHYGQLPVEKVWSDGDQNHLGTPVYVLLCQTGEHGDTPVPDAQGFARILRLDDGNGWTGVFRVALPEKDASPADLGYFVREVTGLSTTDNGGTCAILENDGVTRLYFLHTGEDGDILSFGSNHYMVTYQPIADTGGWTVTNTLAVTLPATGGHGTHMYTISGLLLTAAALVLGYSLRRKRERGAVV